MEGFTISDSTNVSKTVLKSNGLKDEEQADDEPNTADVKSKTQQVLQQFYDYDFHSDEEFLNGWEKIPNKENPNNYLKAKAFYYSRKFDSVAVNDYKSWLMDRNIQDKGPPSDKKVDAAKDSNIHKECLMEDNGAKHENESISFGKVIEYIEKGLTLPGIQDLNIEVTDTEPKPSEIQRKKKPWEIE